MNLLVTNTRNSQAYSVIRALRPYAERVVVTMSGNSRLAARLSHAANSALVDKRYHVPSPADDWRAGRIQRENTDNEERYIQALLRLCETEKIDTIFPSFDPDVYVLSKNKERFQRLGITVPVPDYEIVLVPLDKYRTVQAASEAGMPAPRSYLLGNGADLQAIAAELGFPLVLKQRFTAAARGFEILRNREELLRVVKRLQRKHNYFIQEYIPGRKHISLLALLDRSGALKMALAGENVRSFYRLHGNFPLARRALDSSPYIGPAAALGKRIGWWGGMTIQMKVDARDGVPKLMEINPRIGESRWQLVAYGINEPLITLQVAKGQAVAPVEDWRIGTMFLCPVEDVISLGIKLLDLAVYKACTRFCSENVPDPLNAPMSVRQLLKSYKESYWDSEKRIYNLYFKHFFSDPLASLTWWLQTMSPTVRAFKEIGR
jgi:predicted ATP-grasp superfamily ATP-dependent carboligase